MNKFKSLSNAKKATIIITVIVIIGLIVGLIVRHNIVKKQEVKKAMAISEQKEKDSDKALKTVESYREKMKAHEIDIASADKEALTNAKQTYESLLAEVKAKKSDIKCTEQEYNSLVKDLETKITEIDTKLKSTEETKAVESKDTSNQKQTTKSSSSNKTARKTNSSTPKSNTTRAPQPTNAPAPPKQNHKIGELCIGRRPSDLGYDHGWHYGRCWWSWNPCAHQDSKGYWSIGDWIWGCQPGMGGQAYKNYTKECFAKPSYQGTCDDNPRNNVEKIVYCYLG